MARSHSLRLLILRRVDGMNQLLKLVAGQADLELALSVARCRFGRRASRGARRLAIIRQSVRIRHEFAIDPDARHRLGLD